MSIVNWNVAAWTECNQKQMSEVRLHMHGHGHWAWERHRAADDTATWIAMLGITIHMIHGLPSTATDDDSSVALGVTSSRHFVSMKLPIMT